MNFSMYEFYEKGADAADYIYFQKNCITEDELHCMLPHFHDSVEFVFMLEGECRIRINTEERTVRAGEITFARCFEPHYYNPEPGATYYVVLISSGYLNDYNDFRREAFPSFMQANEGFQKIREFLDFSYSVRAAANGSLKKGFADMLLGLMRLWYPLEPVRNAKATQAFIEVLKYINENFSKPISLESLADRFGYTKTYLSELFNGFTGMRLREYINRCRIGEYYRLRREQPGVPACKIAEQVGFCSPNTFYRALQRYPNDPNF